MRLLNSALLKQPANYLIVGLMVLFAAIAFRLVAGNLSEKEG